MTEVERNFERERLIREGMPLVPIKHHADYAFYCMRCEIRKPRKDIRDFVDGFLQNLE